MNKTIYKQYDSRWGSLPYPDKCSRLDDSGCGCVSVLHCIIERYKYRNKTPKDIQPYMKQFAISGQGTLWSGITTALGHYGMEKIKTHDTMANLWKELAKGDRVGVIWFRKSGCSATGPDGTCWTSTGHYVAFTDYKVEGKKHYLYIKDSGQRQHSGWYCYETSMKGCVYEVCSCKVPPLTNEEKIKKTTRELSWAKGTKKSKFAYKGGKPTSAFKKAFEKVYPDRSKWGAAPKKGCACDVAVGTIMRFSGVDPKFPRGFNQQFTHNNKNYKAHEKSNAVPYDIIKKLGTSGGYVVEYQKASGSVHTVMYINGVVYEAQLEKTYLHRSSTLKKVKTKYKKVRVLEFL